MRPTLIAALLLSFNVHAADKAIRFGKLWDGHRVVPNAVVIVSGDRIQSVTPNGEIPPEPRPSICAVTPACPG